jgi:hypothetical protein
LAHVGFCFGALLRQAAPFLFSRSTQFSRSFHAKSGLYSPFVLFTHNTT